MNELILDSLQVRGFRTFEALEIPRLGRVNLITGKNNVGKTCLLEALQLYARRGEPAVLRQLLRRREETYYSNTLKQDEAMNLLSDIKYLFHGRPNVASGTCRLEVGSLSQPANRLALEVESGQLEQRSLFSTEEMLAAKVSESNVLQFSIRIGESPFPVSVPMLPSYFGNRFIPGLSDTGIKHTFIWSRGLSNPQLGYWWDEIALTDREDDVIAALGIIAPGITRVSMVSQHSGNPERTAIIKTRGHTNPLPMRSLGEGMNRMFGLALALATSDGGMLLVDEIETGLHYSVQADMWRVIFATAQRLNVQVFATTHSLDCIRAFEEAAREDKHEEAVLIRLEERGGKVIAIDFDERKLAIATREGIEVR